MTPNAKDTAEDIFVKMLETIPDYIVQDKWQACEIAKLHATICVNEMLSLGALVGSDLSDNFYSYWKDVKSEIEKI